MAGDALIGCALIYTILMTIRTTQVFVFPDKRETGIIVVEGCIPPTAGVMTGSAVCPELSVVFVIAGMTGKTICRCALVDAVGMTRTALNIRMPAGKREAGIVVIKVHIRPFGGFMTCTTIRSELSVVSIL